MSYPKPIKPIVTLDSSRPGDPSEILNHPAFGTVVVSHPTGRRHLFGSSVPAPSYVSLEIYNATLKRSLSNDWVHPGPAIISIALTHAQWSQIVANPGRGEGTPCTIQWLRGEGSIPGIEPIETRHETHQREINEMAERRIAAAGEALADLQAAFESGAGKKEMRELIRKAQHQVSALPNSVSFVVDQAHEALENSVAEAKIEVEAFIGSKVSQLGFTTLQSMGDAIDRAIPPTHNILENRGD